MEHSYTTISDKIDAIRKFLNNLNKHKVLIIIGDMDDILNSMSEYKDFLCHHERSLSINLYDISNSYDPYFYLHYYEKLKRLYLSSDVEMYNPFILHFEKQVKCPYYSINEDVSTFNPKQIYIRNLYDKFTQALSEEYGDSCEIIYFIKKC